MVATHLVLLVEEPSMKSFLSGLLPRVIPLGGTFEIHAFQGKGDLLRKLDARLRGYASWLPLLQRYSYFKAGLPKVEVARAIAAHITPRANQSPSFHAFIRIIDAAFC